MKFTRTFVATVCACVAAFTLSACSDEEKATVTASNPGSDLKEIKVGLVGEHNEEWESVAKELEGQGIKLTLVRFGDYTLPNAALNEGEIDLNSFQHKAFLENEIKSRGYKIKAIQNTTISLLPLYSVKIKSIDEIKDGDTIAIPNDVTNGGRALKVLESAGLIKLDPAKGYVPEVGDIIENPKNLKIYELDAGNVPGILPDVAAGIVNANFASDHNLTIEKDAIFSENLGNISPDNPFINVIAAREEDADREEYKKVIKAYATKKTAEIINQKYKGATIAVFKY